MASIPAKALVMVGDGEKALFLINEGDSAFPSLKVLNRVEQENPPTREQGSDRPGRFNDGGAAGAHTSAVADTDWQRLEKERFAKDVAAILYKSAHRNEYDKLILVAPPKVLGDLRPQLHKEVTGRLLYDVPKELTNHSVDGIETTLKAHDA